MCDISEELVQLTLVWGFAPNLQQNTLSSLYYQDFFFFDFQYIIIIIIATEANLLSWMSSSLSWSPWMASCDARASVVSVTPCARVVDAWERWLPNLPRAALRCLLVSGLLLLLCPFCQRFPLALLTRTRPISSLVLASSSPCTIQKGHVDKWRHYHARA